MAKYTVLIHQFVEQLAKVEVEAENEEKAADVVGERLRSGSWPTDWTEGDDADRPEIYAVLDEHGDVAMEI